MASNSSVKGLGFRERIREWSQFFMMRFRGLWSCEDFGWLWKNIAEYEAGIAGFTGKKLTDAAVLEIGYGARPYRLLSLLSMGVDVRGVDLDAPLLRGRPSEFVAICRKNGLERLVKSFVRFFCFDWKQRSDLRRELRGKGFKLRVPKRAGVEFIVEDASSAAMNEKVAPCSLDFVFSEDVFEHIPAAALPLLVANLAKWLRPGGVAFIRPNIFTGITGGHHVEWYASNVDRPFARKTEPWEHLRKKRHPANTFLNGLTRADYRKLFAPHFEIVQEKVTHPDLGRQLLTDEIRGELAAFSDEELFSNQVLFVLKPKHADVATAI
jgi:SAM-dependent methyltransferase